MNLLGLPTKITFALLFTVAQPLSFAARKNVKIKPSPTSIEEEIRTADEILGTPIKPVEKPLPMPAPVVVPQSSSSASSSSAPASVTPTAPATTIPVLSPPQVSVPRNNSRQDPAVTEPPKPAALKVSTATGDLRVSQINSCGTIDKIGWVLKSGGKRTRRIFHDYLRIDGERKESLWSLHQVLSDKGDVSFVFERERQDGKNEYIAAKGSTLERIVEIKKGRRRLVDQQNMKPLINSMALGFVTKDGSRVEFIPGQTGRSSVILYPTDDVGVGLAPVYLKGKACDKPDTFKDDEKGQEKKFPTPTEGAPGAGASGGDKK